MGPIVNRLIGKFGTGVGMAAEYAEHRKGKQSVQKTPGTSEASYETASSSRAESHVQAAGSMPITSSERGDGLASSSREHSQGQATGSMPPTYAESVDLGSDHQLEAGPPAQGDNKVQHDEDLSDEEGSQLDDDDDDLTLSDLVDEDEAAWALDEYSAAHAPPSYEDATTVVSEDELVREIVAAQQAHESRQAHGKLPCPVILPQRRPHNKSRGFVRAYAPVLQNVGIDQATFLRFLTNFHKSTQASPWFTVVEVSSIAAHAAGPAIGFAVEAAVKAAVTVGRNLDTAHKTNNFLDRMNDELFKPAGTFAFLMKYKTDANMPDGGDGFFGVVAANINLTTNQVVAKYGQQGDALSGLVNKMSMFRIAAGVTEGAEDLPESAPLIFPELDEEVARGGDQSLKGMSGDVSTFVQDYLDRRAQIKFARSDSKSGLNLPQEQVQMKSSLADPDHPMFNSGVVGLLTGGYLNLRSLKTQRKDARQERRASRRENLQERREVRHERKLDRHQRKLDRGIRGFEKRYGKSPSSTSLSTPTTEVKDAEFSASSEMSSRPQRRARRRHGRRAAGGVRGTVSKLMTEDVVYLMVVNMPTDLDLSATMETA